MKTIALIGSNGQLGTDIQDVFKNDSAFHIVPLTRRDIDVTSIDAASKKLLQIKPDIVINTAAYHRVDEIEDNAGEAFFVNGITQKNLGRLCEKNGWTLVFWSTDYVFGLEKNRKEPYIETSATGPVNAYGVSKLAGEMFTRIYSPKHFVIRVSGLFGTVGSMGKGGNFVELMVKLGKEKGEVSVVNDQVLTPTYTKNIAENLMELLKTNAYGTYHMTSEGQCSWYEFAQEIFQLMKMDVKCNAVDSNTFKTKARRPAYSVLENKALKDLGINKMRDWKENLTLYLREKKYI